MPTENTDTMSKIIDTVDPRPLSGGEEFGYSSLQIRRIEMKKMMIMFGMMAAVLAGCDETVSVSNGEIPDTYLGQARLFMGRYVGSSQTYTVDGKGYLKLLSTAGIFELSLQGNRPVLTYQNPSANDLIGDGCHSRIGQLLSVSITKDGKHLRGAEFAFDAGACTNFVAAKTLAIFFDKDKNGNIEKIMSRLFVRSDSHESCTHTGGPDGESCSTIYDPIYLSGTFRPQAN